MTEPAQQPDETPQKMKPSIIRRLAVFGLVLFLGLQLVPIDRHNPEVVADINAPEEVKLILRRACYDCHSNETKWPWYSYVAPGSWLMAKDVREGRDYLNFSEWGDYYEMEETPEYFLDECFGSIESGEMPLWFYLPMHPEAKLTAEDMKILKEWCQAEESVVSEEIEEDIES
ncbi:heme-binding domain-containing protein [Rubinisphaera sp.]|mgnify:FL=1|uniref:heme-binding domain-containing protein n=1 Tax=Rubinisphaera sp. TaxID=2024857 RepID=UPI0025E5CE70|nr:heme-binding domain-containing protein [Rubinisphaera sp.]|tara:strand:+ start:1098 stop:1616 length:519 start_codon:yes stop_codon:yes gene_type:complete